MIRLNDILDTVVIYNPSADLNLIRKAYVYCAKVHQGQTRLSGEPYIIHPLEVAGLLAGLKLDVASIVTGFLHDTIEDTLTTSEELAEMFGKEVAELVDGVTKISKIHFKTKEENQAENFRKMLIAMANDIRVILVKLADRLHNMRTLQFQPDTKQRSISRETMDIYSRMSILIWQPRSSVRSRNGNPLSMIFRMRSARSWLNTRLLARCPVAASTSILSTARWKSVRLILRRSMT